MGEKGKDKVHPASSLIHITRSSPFALVWRSGEMRIAATTFSPSRNGSMFDLHNHCLPGLDDGSRDWEESLEMARMAVDDGIEGVVCTPHWVRGAYENNREQTLNAVEVFREKLDAHGIPLKIYPGSEIRLEVDLHQGIESGELLTINDSMNVVLIELPPEILPRNLEDLFWDMQVRGIRPIISHPERNLAFLRDPLRLFKLTEMGILTQVTGSSLLGIFGERVRRFTILLLEHRMAHILASDAHGLDARSPRLADARKEAARIVGRDMATQMVREIPWQIIQGEPVSTPEPVPLETRSSKPSFWKNPLSFLGLGRKPRR
jgi:protein-tyrosine phosphatase